MQCCQDPGFGPSSSTDTRTVSAVWFRKIVQTWNSNGSSVSIAVRLKRLRTSISTRPFQIQHAILKMDDLLPPANGFPPFGLTAVKEMLEVTIAARLNSSTVPLFLPDWLKCCFTSTETVDLLGTGAQDVHLDFHTAPELRFCPAVSAVYYFARTYKTNGSDRMRFELSSLSPFLIGRMFLCEPSWKYSAKLYSGSKKLRSACSGNIRPIRRLLPLTR